uniref:Xyloglucan endotransglucosylase/hydrolase n=1 Tax=Kalanchoe fedtschenkoi TaxID=63787 RepID=A0A7N0R8T5_KALFE
MKGLLSLLLYMALLWAHLITITHSSVVSTGDFNQDFVWSDSDHVRISPSGHSLTLVLGKKSGGDAALIISKKQFIFGQYDMQIKLTLDEKGRSTGTAAYYLLTSFSKDGNQDMILFEFIPNENGKGYILQTNIYTNGHGKREETINLWFDPTDKFHKYSIFWNKYHVTFKVDGVAIRVFKNYSDRGAEYLSTSKPMVLVGGFGKDGKFATLVEPSGVKTTRVKHEHNGRDWSKTPSSATFKSFKIDACVWKGKNAADCSIPSKTKWWNYPKYSGPTSREVADIKSIRKNYLVYDYCHDHGKFGGHMPKECSFPKY